MIDLRKKRITITGGKGFLGAHVVRLLKEKRCCEFVSIADLPEYDLRDISSIRRMIDRQNPEIIIHLAAIVGGIGANRAYPGKFFFDNAIMGIQLIHEACVRKIEKLVILGTICCYPKYTPVPFKEENLWNGYPEDTNAPYGLAKKMLLVQSQAYRKQYGFNSIFLMPVNIYGPGDNFDPETSHVIPALIRKCVEAQSAGKKSIVVWGSGNASREFIYVEDAAEGIIQATEKYDQPDPINLGTGIEIKIKDLVKKIINTCGFKLDVVYDSSKPDGQPRRMLDISKAKLYFGFTAITPFKKGLKITIDKYLKNDK